MYIPFSDFTCNYLCMWVHVYRCAILAHIHLCNLYNDQENIWLLNHLGKYVESFLKSKGHAFGWVQPNNLLVFNL